MSVKLGRRHERPVEIDVFEFDLWWNDTLDRDNGFRTAWRLEGVLLWSTDPTRVGPSPVIRQYLRPDPLD